MPVLVQNEIEETPPGDGEVRLGMDFGNLAEVLAGDLVDDCDVSVNSGTYTALTMVPGSVEITGGYLASALFTGGGVGTYQITFTPTLVSGQTLPPRTGILKLR